MIENGSIENWPSQVIIYTDGASRGNPGPSSFGVTVIDKSGATIYECAQNLGVKTNNFAEYSAVKKALELALKHKVSDLILRSDSEFLIKQMRGEYKVRSENIKPLYLECIAIAKKIPNVKFEHVRREFNKRADELANQSLDS